MNKILIPLFVLVLHHTYSQLRIITVLDAKNNSPIANAVIFDHEKEIASSDTLGNASIPINFLSSTLKIRHIAYQEETFDFTGESNFCFLMPQASALDEVVIYKNQNKRKIKSLSPIESVRKFLPENYGLSPPIQTNMVSAVYIPNMTPSKRQIIKRISIGTSDYKKRLKSGKIVKAKNVQFAPFLLNIFSVDTSNGIPNRKLLAKDLILQKQKNQTYAIVNFDEHESVILPSEGIFISFWNMDSIELSKFGFDDPPGISLIAVSVTNRFLPYQKLIFADFEPIWSQNNYLIKRQNTYDIHVDIEEYE
ncbi:peptidase associated/transthyretin-like domain-containing protein [Flavobacterium aurantiibacter]|uniref:Carboxypeptidase-like regulatory domain-containing protein n=1 Tax=Flavobacterium aurantiibacter TaxID=2023067 RepID=A0A256A176_9FLAO|nr:hypothetical protein [Flavobacterium aurantiibacter]OYQ46810.1 hypothetical protein CHX27_03930 [Flavobacterium aurantiibacter]